ncbi:MAG TPA: tetratricopeptide repeat protein [Bryobacterales bacterium]|nr:tetratricopeptide repeat protein [Bryobacterales bacterium]
MPTPNWRHLFLAAGLLVLFSAVSLAQTSSLEGDVKDEHGGPLVGAWVKIDRKDIKGHYQVKTNKKGHYFHAGLPLGVYRVSLEVDGKEMDFVDNVHTKFGDTVEVSFNMADVKARQNAAAAGAPITQEQARQMSPEQRRQIEESLKKRQEQLSKNKALNDAFNGGMAAKSAKNWDAAIQSFEKGAEIDPKQHVIWANLAECQVEASAAKPGAEGQALMAKAMENYQKAIELKPDDAAYHNNYGLALARAGKYPEAQAELAKAAQLDPPNAGRYFFNLGAILVNTGHSEEAYEAFKKAVAADPNYADAHYQIGLYLLSKAQIAADGKITPQPGTLEEFQKYLDLKPDGPYAASAKGSIQALSGSVQTEFSKQPQKKGRK